MCLYLMERNGNNLSFSSETRSDMLKQNCYPIWVVISHLASLPLAWHKHSRQLGGTDPCLCYAYAYACVKRLQQDISHHSTNISLANLQGQRFKVKPCKSICSSEEHPDGRHVRNLFSGGAPAEFKGQAAICARDPLPILGAPYLLVLHLQPSQDVHLAAEDVSLLPAPQPQGAYACSGGTLACWP